MQTQTPIVKLGTKLKDGIVIAIRCGSVDILGESGVQTLKFTTVENEVLNVGS